MSNIEGKPDDQMTNEVPVIQSEVEEPRGKTSWLVQRIVRLRLGRSG
jgi:hypothetical protein